MIRNHCLSIAGVEVRVQRKRIKHLYIRIDPRDGQVCVSAPTAMSETTLRRAVGARMDWIHRRLACRAERPAREYADGETHQVLGTPHQLRVVESPGRPVARGLDGDVIELRVRPGADAAARRALLERWYRARLAAALPPLVHAWEPVLGVRVAEWRIKRMKTRWGSCNTQVRRIWLSLMLAWRPRECLEYVLVHEMVHLLERRHNARFHGLMDQFLPDWRVRRARLRA